MKDGLKTDSVWRLVTTGEDLAADLWKLNSCEGNRRMLGCLKMMLRRASHGTNLVVMESALAKLDRLNDAPPRVWFH